jgi:hypothetical protein
VKRAYSIIAISLAGALTLNSIVFHTRLYPYFLEPGSSTGYVETVLYHERARVKTGPNQILGVGDSRMALVPKNANEANSGYQYGTIAVSGTTPRCWYYMLRAIDPDANQYKAIVFGVDSFNDDETFEDYADRETDLNYVIHQLRLSDAAEFAGSFPTPQKQLRAASGIALKGLVYKRDFADFMLHPLQRVRTVRQSWRDSFGWYYGFRSDDNTLTGLQVDWEHRTLTTPAGLAPERIEGLRRTLVDPLPAQSGRRGAYLKYWYGKIRDHYKGSQTRLVFARLPRAAWIRPDLPVNPKSSLHALQQEPNVTLLPEHLFDELETPERFHDEVHMNQGGLDRFTELLVPTIVDVLGPAR